MKKCLTLKDVQLQLVGDVHLGRVFKNGVPLDKRGVREAMVQEDFIRQITPDPGTHAVIQVGDIFDKFRVSLDVVVWTYEVIMNVSAAHPTVEFIFYRGNHDASREVDRRSSFDLLEIMCSRRKNVHILSTSPQLFTIGNVKFAVLPWHPFQSAAELAQDLEEKLDAVFGHWDIESFGDDTFNLVPIEQLKGLTDTVVTGHVHLPQELTIEGVRVIVTGSMQPYSHGEDPDHNLYLTLSLTEFNEAKPEDLQGKCVRLLLEPNQIVPDITDLDVLQFSVKRTTDADEEDAVVDLGDFDMVALFTESFIEHEVDPEVTDRVLNRFKELRTC